MTLRKKNFIVSAFSLLLLLLLLDITFTNFLRKSGDELDRAHMEQDLSRVVLSISSEGQMLNAVSELWANSDATWDYMNGRNPGFPDTGLDRKVLTTLGISSMIFLDNDYNVRLFKDYSTPEEPSAPDREFSAIFIDTPQNMELLDDLPLMGVKGIAQVGGEPVLFSLQPIMDSNMKGPRAGYLIVTRALNASLVHNISKTTNFSFAIEPATAEERRQDGLPATRIGGSPTGAGSVSGRKLVRDHSGAPAFWIAGIAPKSDVSAIEWQMQKLFLLFAALALLICLAYDRFFKHAFTDRINRLRDEIVHARDFTMTKAHVTADEKKNELSSLARALNDTFAYMDFSKEYRERQDDITIKVYERFARAGSRLCMKTLEDLATVFTPRDENFRSAIPRAAEMTRTFAQKMDLDTEECLYAYMGALFSRIGLLGLPFKIRSKNTEMTPEQLREYKKYPAISKDFLESIELLRPATELPYSWRENWDGTGFPRGLSGSAIPLAARLFAIVNDWNEMTRPWLGRRIPSDDEVIEKLRAKAGTRLDPQLVEIFIEILLDKKNAGGNDQWER